METSENAKIHGKDLQYQSKKKPLKKLIKTYFSLTTTHKLISTNDPIPVNEFQ